MQVKNYNQIFGSKTETARLTWIILGHLSPRISLWPWMIPSLVFILISLKLGLFTMETIVFWWASATFCLVCSFNKETSYRVRVIKLNYLLLFQDFLFGKFITCTLTGESGQKPLQVRSRSPDEPALTSNSASITAVWVEANIVSPWKVLLPTCEIHVNQNEKNVSGNVNLNYRLTPIRMYVVSIACLL